MKTSSSISIITAVFAATIALAVPSPRAAKVREVPVTLTAQVVNNTIVVTAVTPRYGRSFHDEWSGPEPIATMAAGGHYVATASWTPLFSGSYGVIYRIWQSNGKSGRYGRQGRAWAWLDVTVAPDGTVTIN